jgi:23S rRNA (pseudouridine1915-N3)-methyltransferase
MMTVRIVCVGDVKEGYWSAAIKEYAKRLEAYCKLEILEIPETKLPSKPSEGDIRLTLESEGKRILAKCEGCHVIALVIEGQMESSVAFSERLETLGVRGVSKIAFVIGGSHGLSTEVKQTADASLSFSPMTFPHQLMRVVLLEQIYRAFSIQKGTSYHK